MRSTFGVLVLAVVPVFLGGCDFEDFGVSDRFKEDFHSSYEVQPGGRLNVENSNGAVEITAWEKNTVDVSGTKYSSTESGMRDIRIDIVQSGNNVNIRTILPTGFRGGMGARYVIRVPARYELDRIISSNGSINVDSVNGTARLKTSNGAVHITRASGKLDVETSNGSIEIRGHDGDAVMRTSNGRIDADGVKGLLEARTSNGSIHARLTDPVPNAPIKVESSNGSIELTLANLKDNPVRATTSNSSITLRLPSSTNAYLRAHTSNSHVSSDFDVLIRGGQATKHTLEGTIGSGGPTIDLGTSNGSIRIQRL
jgi:hypothetical protein